MRLTSTLSIFLFVFVSGCGSDSPKIGPEVSSASGAGGASNSSSNSTSGSGGSGTGGTTSTTSTGSGGSMQQNSAAGYVSGSRLRARYYEGSDGSKEFLGWYDSTRSENCDARFGSDGIMRCLPSVPQLKPGNQQPNVYYVDSSCTVRAYGFTDGCPVPSSVEVLGAGFASCGGGRAHHMMAIGKKHDFGPVYRRPGSSSNDCDQAFPPATIDLYVVGDEIAPTEFVEFTSKVE